MTFIEKRIDFETNHELDLDHLVVSILDISDLLIESKIDLEESDFDLLVDFCDRFLNESEFDCDQVVDMFKELFTNKEQLFIHALRTMPDELYKQLYFSMIIFLQRLS